MNHNWEIIESAGKEPNIVSSLSTSHYMYGWMIRVFINIELRNEKVTNGSTPSRKYTFTRIIHDVYHMHPNSGRGRGRGRTGGCGRSISSNEYMRIAHPTSDIRHPHRIQYKYRTVYLCTYKTIETKAMFGVWWHDILCVLLRR